MSSRPESRRSAQQLPLRSSEQLKASFGKSERGAGSQPALRNSEHGTETLSESEQIAAELLDAAFSDPRVRLTNQEIAHLCKVTESLVQKWRSKTQRGGPSFVQMLCLPPAFHFALHKAMNRRFGFGVMALNELMEAAGLIAMVIR